ncbi:uncharacterized protein LOC109716824 isoform X3 [Ananas comosus]|uniref:phosphoglycerate mutase (2,3-diphosphoglycerate-dependent) n=1 Tax=Ananas comosus TaxID=4615 RepID=A0A6P5FQN7_ANACO|nr:uncharacterized protein LOC109716824 isoform X3 [Ananas comosus]
MGGASLVAAAAPPPPGILAIRNLKPLGVRRLFSFSCSNSYPPNCSGKQRNLITLVHCSINNVSTEIINNVSTESPPESEVSMTGAAYDFKGATTSLTNELLSSAKKVTLVRHGLSSWNEESRVQGSSDLSILTETGAMQAERCCNALINMNFDICFSSPISRAKRMLRRNTQNCIPNGEKILLIFMSKVFILYEGCGELQEKLGKKFCSHRFRSIDVNNGGISTFTINKRGEAMLQSLNMTAHMYSNHVYQF